MGKCCRGCFAKKGASLVPETTLSQGFAAAATWHHDTGFERMYFRRMHRFPNNTETWFVLCDVADSLVRPAPMHFYKSSYCVWVVYLMSHIC